MSTNPIIKCDLCGYQFKTFGKMEDAYEEYQKYQEMRYYPEPSENAHLIRNYICDRCYQQLVEIVRKQMVRSGRESLRYVDKEIEKVHEEYLAKVSNIRKAASYLENVLEQIEKTPRFFELSKEVQHYIMNGCPYYLKGSYYFDRAITWEREHILKQKYLSDWEKKYDLKVEDYPDNVEWGSMVTEQQFMDILLDSKVKNKTIRDILKIVEAFKKEQEIG